VQVGPGIKGRHIFRSLVLVSQRFAICHFAPMYPPRSDLSPWVSAATFGSCTADNRASPVRTGGFLITNPSRNAVVKTITLERLPSYHFLVIPETRIAVFCSQYEIEVPCFRSIARFSRAIHPWPQFSNREKDEARLLRASLKRIKILKTARSFLRLSTFDAPEPGKVTPNEATKLPLW
jgi:hypothetical protein